MGDGAGDKKQLGKIMLKQRLVTPDELDGLLARQKAQPGKRLASVAAEEGAIPEVALLKALSEQHGLPGIDLSQVVIALENLELVPLEIASRHLILPILVKDDRVFLAMADPADRRIIDEIEFVTGRRVFPYVALQDSLRATIEACYRQKDRGEPFYIGTNAPKDYLESLGLAGDASEEGASGRRSSPSEPAEPAPGSAGAVVADPVPGTAGDELGINQLRGEDREPEEEPPTTPRGPRDKPMLLVVDDEDDIRRLLRRVLSEKGYEVIEASKGLDALQAVRDQVPDLILLDAMLPELHGFDICRRIKGSKRYGHIPIIMVSAIYRGWRFAEDLKQSYGVDAFLEKPFKIGDVLSAVETALEGTSPEKGASEPPSDDDLSRAAGDSLREGIDSYREGDLDGAIAKLKEGLGVDPLSFQLHYHLGLLYGRRDDLFEAIHELETAVDLSPRSFPALKNLAVLYQKAGFKHKAIEMWERALGNAPDDPTRKGIKEHLMNLL